MDTASGKPDRTLIILLSVVAVLVVAALVAVFTRGEPEALDPGTPEGVVQGYATAVIDGDEKAAGTYLTEDAFPNCEKFGQAPMQDLRVTLVSTTERADSADVKVSIVTSSGNGPFGADEYETQGVFDLVKVNGDWLIHDAPYELMICPNPKAAA